MRAAKIAGHAAPYVLLTGIALAATWSLFAAPGMPYNVDISGFFPLSPEAYEGRFWPLWNERGGMSTLQFVPALLVELPFLVVGSRLGWGMDLHIKVRILFGFALAGAAMYALARHYLDRYYAEKLGAWTRAALPLVPAIFFMLNPWSVHRVFHYFLWLGYAFSPLVVLAFERLAHKPSWKRGVGFAFVTALATTDPHNPPYFAILLAPFLVVRAIAAWRDRRLAKLAVAMGAAAGAYLLLGAYWILPYAFSAATNPGFGPTYVMSDEMLGILSRNAGFWEALRLTHNYLPRAPLMPEGGALLTAWNVASLVVPALALGALFLAWRRGAVWALGAVGLGSLALGLGANLGGAYHWLLFDAPWGEGLSWLFRDPYRWGGFQALAYAAMLAFALAELGVLTRRAPKVLRGGLGASGPSVALAATALFVIPALSGYVAAVYAPVEIPSEYAAANKHLELTPPDAGVVWMPRALGSTTWSGDRTLAYFDATSSSRAALGPFRPHTSTYFRLVEDAAKDGADVPSLLARAGTERIVFHNDRNPAADASIAYTLEDTGFTREARVGDTTTRTVDQSSYAPANVPAAKYAINGSKTLEQTFVPIFRGPVLLTLRADAVNAPPPLVLRILDANGSTVATRSAVLEADEHEVAIVLRGVELVPRQPYTLRLDVDNATGSAGSRWELSYYKVDTYARGAANVTSDGLKWRPLAGDLAFELQSEARGFITVLKSPEPAPRVRVAPTSIVSPGSLQTLRALDALPEGSALREAPVVFTAANEQARTAIASAEGMRWVAPLDASEWEAVVPYLPKDVIIAPFAYTTSADGKAGWARGTEEFTYYEYGWASSLAALDQEAWDLDGDRGLIYTSARSNLSIPIDAAVDGARAIVLARVYEHPLGGRLKVYGDDTLVSAVDTRAATAGFRWVEVGTLPAGATQLRLEGDGSFLGVNLLAVVPPDVLTRARQASADAFARTPVTLLSQAETQPALNTRITALPRVGRFAELNGSAELAFHTPARGDHAVWLRLSNGTTPPFVAIDGMDVGLLVCAADCDGPAPWFATPLGALEPGRHVLALRTGASGERAAVDLVAVTTEPAGFAPAATTPDATWERLDATRYRVSIDAKGPVSVVLATPYDAGWVARLPDGARVRSVIADGVVNVFHVELEGASTIEIVYEPQTWASRGVAVSIAALAACAAMLLVGIRRTFGRSDATVEETS